MAVTENLELFKHDEPLASNEEQFNIKKALNDNFDILDEAVGDLQDKVIEHDEHITAMRQDIADIQKEQTAQDTNIENLQKSVETNTKSIQTLDNDVRANADAITENTSDIEDLQAEYTALKEELEKQKEDNKLNSLTEDNEGELIHITDATGSRFNSLEISGNEKQDTREGYNLFDILNATIQNQDKGVTVSINNDGYITANGTPTSTYIGFVTENNIDNKLEDGETYTLWQENYSSTKYGGIYIQVTANPISGSSEITKYIEASNKKTTFVVDKTNYTYMLKLQTSTIENAGTFNNYKNRYMLYKGTDDKEYELYGTMPSFDYPSKIEAVGDNINLFDKNSITADKCINGNLTNTKNAYGDLINSTVTNTSDFMPVLKNKNYIFHFVCENLVATSARGYCFYNKEKQLIESNVDTTYNPVNKEFQVTAKQDGYIRISYDKNCTNIKFEQGEKATAYSEYGHGCVALNITDKNILDTNSINSTLSGVKFESNLDGSLNISGTPTKSFISVRANLKLDYPIKSGTKISCLFGKTVDLQKDSELTPYVWTSDENNNSGGNINRTNGYSLIVKRDITNITLGIEGFNTSTNYNTKLYLMLVVEDITQSQYIQFQKQTYVIPVQQKMLSGDKFIKVNGEWKEMHTWLELFFDGVNRKFNQEATNTSGKYRLLYHISEKVKDCDTTNGTKAYCSNSKLTAKGETHSCNEGFTVANNIIYIYIDGRTASAINAELQDNQITFYIPLKEDDYKYLDCTEEQIEILDKIEKEAHTYLNTTNIYTEDEIGAIIKTNTNVDLSKMINNVVEAQLSQIGG